MASSKVIGFFTSWGSEDFAVRAIQNHLKICDEIYCSIEAHSPEMQQYMDDTSQKIRELNDNRIKIIPNLNLVEKFSNPDHAKCAILNYMLKFVEEKSIVMLCDSDEFYNDEAIDELKVNFRKHRDWDFLRVHDYFFCINTNWYLKHAHGRFWKIKANAKFYPTQNIYPPFRKEKLILEENPMFHFSMLVPVEYKRTFWQGEQRHVQVDWLDNIYSKWDLYDKNLQEELVKENYRLTGNKGFWFNDGLIEVPEKAPYLFERDFPLPKEIEDLNIVEDFR